MKIDNSPPLREASKFIREFLEQHPEVGGIKGLAEKAGLSYDSVQKYAKGSNLPPKKKWAVLCAIFGFSPEVTGSPKVLFDDTTENKTMKTPSAENVDKDSAPQHEGSAQTRSVTPDRTTQQGHAVSSGEDDCIDLIADKEGWTRAEDRQEIFLPVHGFVWFYPEEIRVIDHPAFQRLAGMHQLGMTYLVYRGATHRRIEHSLGAVGVAQRMIEAVTHNCSKRNIARVDPKDQWLLGHPPTASERRFIRLATLLHDIGHVPFGHTIEDELRLLNKHDGEQRIDRIFGKRNWHGKDIGTLAELIDELYEKYVPGEAAEHKPSALLKRIILKPSKDQTHEQQAAERTTEVALAHAGLRIKICRDLVGDTICADLLDYLHRDWYHVGKPRYFDERILHYMEIRTPISNASISLNESPQPTADDVFVISIGNRPKLRSDGISAILSLLESRYELAEAVLFHRTKMNATAMLERALSLAVPESKESIPDLEGWLLANPEDTLLPALLDGNGPTGSADAGIERQHARSLISRLLRRDLYDLLLMVTYDEFPGRDVDFVQRKFGDDDDAALNRAKALRLLEQDFGLEPGSIVMYCPESRMNRKIAEVQIFVENVVRRFDEYEREHKNALSAGHLQAQLDRFRSLWKIGFFINPEVQKDKGEEFVSQLRDAIRFLILDWYPRDQPVNTLTARIARNVVLIEQFHLYGCTSKSEARELRGARANAAVATEVYPSGARILLDFIERDGRRDGSPSA